MSDMGMFAAIALVLTGAALACLLPSLLGRAAHGPGDPGAQRLNLLVLRDQLRELDADLAAGTILEPAYRDARAELTRRAARELEPEAGAGAGATQAWLALLLALGLPALAAGMYFHVGAPAALAPPAGGGAAHRETPAEIGVMVQALANRLQRQPGDIEGWHMLARSYAALGRFDDAALAYGRVAKLAPEDPDALADYADALATARGGALAGEPERLAARALARDPRHPKALALAGAAAYARGDYAQALARWEAARAQAPPDSPFAHATAASIAQARARLGLAPGAPPAAAGGAGGIRGTVELAPALSGEVRPGDTLFIVARAPSGGRLPLAVLRASAAELPLHFVLDDRHGMVEGLALSAHESVILSARISRSGNAAGAAGDLEGSAGKVSSRAQGLRLVIDSRRKQ